jgi:hypothetical protein
VSAGAQPALDELGGACQEPPPDGITERLVGKWIHAREEDRPGVKVYRPSGFRLPPARGRDSFAIERQGGFTQWSIAKGDGTDARKGQWKPAGANQIRIRFDSGAPERTVRILTVTPDKLEIYDPATDPKESAHK